MEMGICPVCNGTKKAEYNGRIYDCQNCGGQKMFGVPTGLVNLRADGTPCKHDYEVTTTRRCWHEYKCKHCSENHVIDSGD